MSPKTFLPLRACRGLSVLSVVMCLSWCAAADIESVRGRLLSGKYAEAAGTAKAAEAEELRAEEWALLHVEGIE